MLHKIVYKLDNYWCKKNAINACQVDGEHLKEVFRLQEDHISKEKV